MPRISASKSITSRRLTSVMARSCAMGSHQGATPQQSGRPVEVNRLNQLVAEGSKEFRTRHIFLQRRKHRGRDVDRILSKHILSNSPSIRSAEEIDLWKKTKHQYALCPVSQRIVQRYLSLYVEEPRAPKRLFDFFVSFGSEDVDLAEQVCQFLRADRKGSFSARKAGT